MSFWGLILEPKKSYTQRGVEQPFHISAAALDLQSSDDSPVSVVCRKSDQDFILCSLSKSKGIFNVPLNLDFELGAEINFHIVGNSPVHLTGYIIDEMEEFDDDSSLDELEEEEAESDLKGAVLKNTKKLLDAAAKRKPETSAQNKSKKAKVEVDEDEDDDEEDDSDFEMEDSMGGEELGEEEEDDDEDDDDEEDDDDDDEDDGEAAEVLKKLQAMKGNKQGKNQPAAKESPKDAKQGKKDQGKGQNQPNKQNGAQSNGIPKKVLAGGVQVEDLQMGNGAVAGKGKQVAMYYVGRLKSNNKQFDACQSGPGFKFRLGKGEVIQGWDVGVAGMKVGGKRRLTIPAKMAYGKEGAGKTIPPNSTLVFDVELRHVK